MIIVRDDDVLTLASKWDDPVSRFIEVHELICQAPNHLFHVPTILVADIQKFPVAVSYMQSEVKKGTMIPEIHGWDHIDYGTIAQGEITGRLLKCIGWFHDTFNYTPTKWYTPWHATSDDMVASAKYLNLQIVLETPNLRLEGIKQIRNNIDCELMIHWWSPQDTNRIERLVNEAAKL